MTPKELEKYLLDFSKDLRYVTATKLPTYIQLMEIMADQRPHNGRGIGYHPSVGWFVLEAGPGDDPPLLIWCEKGAPV